MAYFTIEQEYALQSIVKTIMEERPDSHEAGIIKEHELEEALKKQSYIETVKDDVLLVADNNYIELTEKQVEDVTNEVVSNYDYSDYNEYIVELIYDLKK